MVPLSGGASPYRSTPLSRNELITSASKLFARAQVALDKIFRHVKTAKQFLSVFSAILRIG